MELLKKSQRRGFFAAFVPTTLTAIMTTLMVMMMTATAMRVESTSPLSCKTIFEILISEENRVAKGAAMQGLDDASEATITNAHAVGGGQGLVGWSLADIGPCLSDMYCPCDLQFHPSEEAYIACLSSCRMDGLSRCPCDLHFDGDAPSMLEEAEDVCPPTQVPTVREVALCYLQSCGRDRGITYREGRMYASLIFLLLLAILFVTAIIIFFS